ncbi:hypothetical protein MAJ_03153, partial [Metarhizium majus ARSEF 297]
MSNIKVGDIDTGGESKTGTSGTLSFLDFGAGSDGPSAASGDAKAGGDGDLNVGQNGRQGVTVGNISTGGKATSGGAYTVSCLSARLGGKGVSSKSGNATAGGRGNINIG